MPFNYDVNRSTTTNAAVATETTHLWAATVSNQQSMGLYAVYFAPFGSAATGAAVARVKTNAGPTAVGGTSTTPKARAHTRVIGSTAGANAAAMAMMAPRAAIWPRGVDRQRGPTSTPKGSTWAARARRVMRLVLDGLRYGLSD